jgi:flagellum-specific peptidoglycan hydrolase FlgJ
LRDYGSVLESAKDFTELMKNTRYAPGLSKARTPREAIQAIAAAGYAGGESTYVDKVLRVMRGKGVNVDQPFATTFLTNP